MPEELEDKIPELEEILKEFDDKFGWLGTYKEIEINNVVIDAKKHLEAKDFIKSTYLKGRKDEREYNIKYEEGLVD